MPNITKRGDAYRIRVSNGRDASGKQIIETATFHPDPERTEKQNQKALQQFALDFERKVKSGNYLEGEKITFSEFVVKWRTLYAKEQLQDTTVEFYDFLLKKHILPAIGNVKLAQLRPAHLIAFYDDLSHKIKPQKGDGDPATYSATTVRRCHACISSILQTAVYWNVITENPCKRVQAPRTAQTTDDVKHFTPEQASAFLEVSQDLVAAYEPGDLRKDQSIVADVVVGSAPRAGWYISKWLHYTAVPVNNNDFAINLPVVRYTDVLLMYAECLNEAGYSATGDAFKYINKVRGRAGLSPLTAATTPDQAAFRKAMMQERRVEFAFEGLRWLDLVRWGKAVEVMDAFLKQPENENGLYKMGTTDRYLYAIPSQEIANYNDKSIMWQNDGF